MASWAGARTAESALHASRSLAAKAVHIDVRPSPRDLHERRGILRVLKQFGDVIMFQPLKVCLLLYIQGYLATNTVMLAGRPRDTVSARYAGDVRRRDVCSEVDL